MSLEHHVDGIEKIRQRLTQDRPLSGQERERLLRYLESLSSDICTQDRPPRICTECVRLREQLSQKQMSDSELKKKLFDGPTRTVMLGRPFETGVRFGCGFIIAQLILFFVGSIALIFLR